MKKRSLHSLALLSVFTLGFYELVWVIKTRNEMVSKYQTKIPSASYVIILRGLQLVGFLAVVAIVFYFIPAANKTADIFESNRVKPSATCFASYNQSDQCRKAIDSYYTPAPDTPLILVGVALGIIVLMGIIYGLFLRRWVVAYALAAQQVTNQELPATVSVLALGGIVPILGMLYTQSVFNRTIIK